jgi:26S proteasome regulatory subunit N10
MALESCMILLDCSEYMRNGDYVPTRLEAQKDAANLLIGAKTQMNPETSVGVSAGTELLLSPTADVGKILGAIHGLQFQPSSVQPPTSAAAIGKPSAADQSNITSAVQVASLALKHRPNKNGAQRIVLFVGTPVTADARALQKAGRALKKNNIAIDVVALGELEENEAKLRELVDAANGSSGGGDGQARTCHLVTIPPGGGVLVSDVLASSPILGQGAFAASAAAASMSMGAGVGAVGGGGGMNDFAEYGGVDPSLDPELAMALRVSMEEERLRQERIAAAAAEAAAQQQQQQAEESKDAEMDEAAAAAGLSEEEALLQQALAMSMNENEPTSAEEDNKPAATEDVEMEDDDEDEDAAMQMALQMSLQQQEPASEFQDPSFINQMLGSMPGVDPNDPEIQEALRKAQEKKEDDSGDKDEPK